MSSITYLLACA